MSNCERPTCSEYASTSFQEIRDQTSRILTSHRSRNDMLVTINDSLQNSSRCSCEDDLQTWSIRITASSEFARCAAMTITSSIRGARTCRSKPQQNQLQTSHSCRQCKLWCCQRSGHNCTCHSTRSYVEDCSSLLGEKFRVTVRSCERSA